MDHAQDLPCQFRDEIWKVFYKVIYLVAAVIAVPIASDGRDPFWDIWQQGS